MIKILQDEEYGPAVPQTAPAPVAPMPAPIPAPAPIPVPAPEPPWGRIPSGITPAPMPVPAPTPAPAPSPIQRMAPDTVPPPSAPPAPPPTQPTPASKDEWFWGIGPGGNENERKLWEAVRYFDPSQGVTPEALAAIQAAFPGTTPSETVEFGIPDKVNIPGFGAVDVVRNTQYGGAQPFQWWWGGPGGSPSPGQPGAGGEPGAGAGAEGAGGGAGVGAGAGYPQVGGVPLDAYAGSPIWDDPALSLLEELSRYRLDELFQDVEDPYRDQFFEMLTQRIGELQQYPWTESQEGTLRTSATDRLQRDRQAAHEEMDRRLAAMGHGQGSGTLVEAHAEVDRQFDELYNAQQQGFDVYAINTVNQRRDQAVGLGATGAQLSQSVRDEEQARRREALTIAALFPELQGQQLNQALAVLSGSPYSGPSIFSQMMQLATLGNQQQQYGQNQNNAFWSGLGSVLFGLGNQTQTQQASYQGYSQPNWTTGLDWSTLPGTAYGLNF